METVVLKNNQTELKVIVKTTMITLDRLINENPIAAYELVQMCKERDHKPFGNTGSILEGYGLLTSGEIHNTIRNIVLSAFDGEGFDMYLTNPVKGVMK